MEVLSRQTLGKGQDMYFDQEAFGKRLKELRNIKGMTQEELAEKVNITREHLGRLERGKYGCSIDLLIELSYTLNASTDYLLLGINPVRKLTSIMHFIIGMNVPVRIIRKISAKVLVMITGKQQPRMPSGRCISL
jgi:transcriptional regulator with XRE-family HTH domain